MRADAFDLTGNLNCAPPLPAAKPGASSVWRHTVESRPTGEGASSVAQPSGGWCSDEERRRWMRERARDAEGQGVVAAATFSVVEGYNVTMKAGSLSAFASRGRQSRDGLVS